ncbi:MAG: nucleotidyl transferase AbiEii/AbiGii toxin family protein [Gammaproteobacteria bacterium]|nr:nucleotidyl transferase AbiEii/AbiGii toxin family protein [Gammaproteobacteria bacterium]
MKNNLAESIRARLLNLSKSEGSDFSTLLTRYALERFLYRISQSEYANIFLLKGALLFALWYDMPHRPTKDIDLLGFGQSDLLTMKRIFQEIATIPCEDGVSFSPTSIIVDEIRKNTGYMGARVILSGELAKARCKIQIDIGFGDAVTPEPIEATYPVLLNDLPAPCLRAYPVYTVIAEKLHAITMLGMANSRLKDYLDLTVMFDREEIDENILARAIFATFKRRSTEIPINLPIGLTDEFGKDTSRQSIWNVFLKKNELQPISLQNVVVTLRTRLESVLNQAALLSSSNPLIPNQKTIDAMNEAVGGQLKSFKTFGALVDDLNNEND